MIPKAAIEMAVLTDVGRVRPHNEDAVFVDAALGLAILADGMGGCNAGEVASSMVTAHIARAIVQAREPKEPHELGAGGILEARRQLQERIQEANAEVYFAASTQAELRGMGTTLVVAWFCNNCVIVGHAGDSRCYRLRAGQLDCITKDHSLIQVRIDSGLDLQSLRGSSDLRHFVTRALGVEPTVEPEMGEFSVSVGDIYLLCSDGLSDMINDQLIAQTLNRFDGSPGEAATALVQLANEAGGRDNISVIVVQVNGDFSARPGWWRKLLHYIG